jgi:CheY-like chemotaxis protein
MMDERYSILLIEDNPGDAFLTKFYLEEGGYASAQLVHSEFLKSAIHLLKKQTFDVA